LINDLSTVRKTEYLNPSNPSRGKMTDLFKPIWSTPPRRATSQWIDLMQKSPRTDPMHKIASDVAATSYKLYAKVYNKETKQNKTEITEHISLDLLNCPCPMDKTITRSRLFYMTEMYMLSPAGECLWLLEKNALGVPTEIYIVPPHWVIQTPTKQIPYFRILPMGNTSYQMVYVDPDDVIWFKDHDLLYPYSRGRGRSEGIADEIETDEYMAKTQKLKFFNGATPDWVGIMPGVDEDAMARTKESWYKEVGGYQNAHKMKFINWDAKFQKMSETSQEMDYVNSRKFLRDTCLQHYNMPPELFGIVENSNRSTIDAAYELYTRNTLSVQLRSFDDSLNAQFFPLFDSKLFIEHDNVIPADKDFVLKQAESGLKNGAMMVDEYRIKNGLDPLPNGKGHILLVPLNMMSINVDNDELTDTPANQNANSPPGKEPKSSGKRITTKQFEQMKAQIWKRNDNGAKKYEQPMSTAVKGFFKTQQNRLIKQLGKSYHQGITKDDETADFDVDDYDWEADDEKLLAAMSAIYLLSAKEGNAAAEELFSLGVDWKLINPAVLKWIQKNGLKAAKDINSTTKDALSKTLTEGMSVGEGIPKLKDRVLDIYDTATTSRAENIARTETHNAHAVGNYETFVKGGVKKKSWLTTMDGRERSWHADMDGEAVGIDEQFSNGLDYPGDPGGDGAEVCNCRCVLMPEFDEGNE